MRGTHGWAEVSRERKREIIDAIVANTPTTGPVHAELDLTDRCNVACYFCNQQDLRTKEQIPIQKTTELIDELASTGLRSVRLSGGGDPLFHREINDVLAHLAKRGVVVDNLTTNGVALNHEIAGYLVNNKAREVIFSLNAVDAADYARMMKVKPALFDKVITAIKTLVEVRGDSIYPSIVLQFLLDRSNITRIVEMYDLGRSLGVDRIAMNAVLEIPRERIDRELLLRPEDADLAEPYVEQVLRKDADAGLLQIPIAALAKEREELFVPGRPDPILLPARSQGLFLVQRIRDEAHRFAVTYHQQLRGKRAVQSVLDEIQGVGPAKKRALLRKFGSVKGMRDATEADLAGVAGVGPALAERIKQAID